jgi:hypothetical protein
MKKIENIINPLYLKPHKNSVPISLLESTTTYLYAYSDQGLVNISKKLPFNVRDVTNEVYRRFVIRGGDSIIVGQGIIVYNNKVIALVTIPEEELGSTYDYYKFKVFLEKTPLISQAFLTKINWIFKHVGVDVKNNLFYEDLVNFFIPAFTLKAENLIDKGKQFSIKFLNKMKEMLTNNMTNNGEN